MLLRPRRMLPAAPPPADKPAALVLDAKPVPSRAGWTEPDAEVERRTSNGWPPRATERKRATSDTITATDKVRGGKYLTLYYS